MDAESLVRFVREWRPEVSSIGPGKPSREGLASTLRQLAGGSGAADFIRAMTPHAKDLPREYLDTLNWGLAEGIKEGRFSEWAVLAAWLKAFEARRSSLPVGDPWEWSGSLYAIENALEKGAGTHTVLSEVLIPYLTALVEDEGAGRVRGGPSEADSSLLDALNDTGPKALRCLFAVAVNYPIVGPDGVRTMPEWLSGPLVSRLGVSNGIQCAVGLNLSRLFWLDRKWVLQNVDRIFAQDLSLFWAAMSGVLMTSKSADLFAALQREYRRALDTVEVVEGAKSAVWFDGLARDLVSSYLQGLDESSPPLLFEMFSKTSSALRSRASWVLYRHIEDSRLPGDSWGLLKAFLVNRLELAKIAGMDADFDEEFSWAAVWIPKVAGDTYVRDALELLTLIAPFVARRGDHLGWTAIEAFVAAQVDTHSLQSLKLYRKLVESSSTLPVYRQTDSQRRLLETAVTMGGDPALEAKRIAGALGERGVTGYQDIFNRVAGSAS